MTSAPSRAQSIYEARISALGKNYDVSEGSRMDATAYASAIAEARIRSVLERAGNQVLPSKLVECLPVREREFGVVPGPNDTLNERKAVLSARYRLPLGPSRINVENALREILSDDFVRYYTIPVGSETLAPPNIGDQPMNLQKPDVPRKLIRITNAISILGSRTVAYTKSTPNVGRLPYSVNLLAGDVLVVEPEIASQTERVTVTAVSAANTQFVATFTKSHEPGCLATTQPFPMWTSTRRYVIVVLKEDAAIDPEKRRKLDELFARLMRGVTRWVIVQETTPIGGFGPFILDTSPLSATTFGEVAPL